MRDRASSSEGGGAINSSICGIYLIKTSVVCCRRLSDEGAKLEEGGSGALTQLQENEVERLGVVAT
jgi:hypothetical protein